MTAQSVDRIASRKSAFGLFTKPTPLKVFPPLQQDHLFAQALLHNAGKLLSCVH